MKYSIVIPYYENEIGLIRALVSIRQQTKIDLIGEIIIVDDCSKINQLDTKLETKINNFFSNMPLKIKFLIQPENKGPGSARNLGILESKFKFVCLLDADEIWDESKIEYVDNLVKELNENFSIIGHKRMIATNTEEIGQFDKEIDPTYIKVTANKILLKNYIPTSSIVINKNNVESLFPEEERFSEDYAFLLTNIFTLRKDCYLINSNLVYTDKHYYAESGLGSNLFKMQIGEIKNYLNVMRDGNIKDVIHISPFLILSNLKFLRRILITQYYKKRNESGLNG